MPLHLMEQPPRFFAASINNIDTDRKINFYTQTLSEFQIMPQGVADHIQTSDSLLFMKKTMLSYILFLLNLSISQHGIPYTI